MVMLEMIMKRHSVAAMLVSGGSAKPRHGLRETLTKACEFCTFL